jgi:hypothetical protein
LGDFFGLVGGGNGKWRFWDYIFGQEHSRQADDDG